MASQEATLTHQAYQAFPKLSSPIVNEDGTLALPWYRLFISLWQRTGAGSQQTNTSAVLVEASPQKAPIAVVDAMTGKVFGELRFSGGGGRPVQEQIVAASPFEYSALADGTLVVDSGQVELSRDGVKFYTCGLAGGALPMLAGDRARVTFYHQAPTVAFFPDI